MKNIKQAVIALAGLIALSLPVAAWADNRVVKIVSREANREAIGTGWFMNKDMVVTCYHVVKDGLSFTLYYDDGTAKTATFRNGDSKSDTAILLVNNPRADQKWYALLPDSQVVHQDEVVHVPGYPRGTYHLSWGKLTDYIWIVPSRADQHVLFSSDCQIGPGDSGGPVLDKDDKVIAMVKASRKDGGGIFISVNVIWESLGLISSVHPHGFETGITEGLDLGTVPDAPPAERSGAPSDPTFVR